MLFTVFRRLLLWQLSGLAYHLDPLANPTESAIAPEDASSSSSSKWNFYFFLPFFIVFLSTLHGNVLLPYSVGVPLTWASLSTSPALFFRQVYLPAMWPQTDFVAIISVLGALAICGSFLKHPWTLPRYGIVANSTTEGGRPLLRIDGRLLSPDTSLAILTVHRRIRKVSFAGFLGASLFAYLFLYTNTFLNGYYSLTNGPYLLALVLLFPFMNVTVYAFFGIPTFLILASLCTQIRQKDLISQMRSLNGKVRRLKKCTPKRHQQAMATFRHQSRHHNRSLLAIVFQLEAYATYWTPALSLLLLHHIAFQTYLAYPVFFIGGIIFLQKITFLYIVIQIDVALFYLIDVCARVVKLNRRIEVANGEFYLLMAQKGAFTGKNICQQLKCEALAVSHRLRLYAFHLFDNYRITSRTFYMVFSDIALFFLLVFKRSQ